MLRALSDRDITLYFIGPTLSTLGDRSLWPAMGIWVKMLTGSSSSPRSRPRPSRPGW